MKLKKWISAGLAIVLTVTAGMSVIAAENGGGQGGPPAPVVYELKAGAAVRDITPTEENGMLPIDAVGRTTAEGVIDPLHTRVIALNDGTNTSLIVSNETGKGPYGPLYAQELSDHTGIPIENIFYTATHAHATPEITGEIDMSYLTFNENDPEIDNVQKWGKLVYDQLMDAADEAIANLEPVTVGIGYSDSYVNVNRNAKYTNPDGTYYWAQGYGFDGFSDKTVAAIRFTSIATGKPVAFIINYAIHGVIMYANQVLDGKTGISSDVGGFICNALESQNEGAVALFLMGAAGDQNPIFGNEYFTPSIETGEKETHNQGSLEVLEFIGKLLYFDTVEAIKNIKTETGNANLGFSYGSTAIPGSDGGDWDVYLQVLRIGNIALVGFPGEMFNEIGVNAIKQSPLKDTIWVNLVWSRPEQQGQKTGYHSTDVITIEGGQGRNTNYLPGYLKDAVKDLTRDLVAESFLEKSEEEENKPTELGDKSELYNEFGAHKGLAEDTENADISGTYNDEYADAYIHAGAYIISDKPTTDKEYEPGIYYETDTFSYGDGLYVIIQDEESPDKFYTLIKSAQDLEIGEEYIYRDGDIRGRLLDDKYTSTHMDGNYKESDFSYVSYDMGGGKLAAQSVERDADKTALASQPEGFTYIYLVSETPADYAQRIANEEAGYEEKAQSEERAYMPVNNHNSVAEPTNNWANIDENSDNNFNDGIARTGGNEGESNTRLYAYSGQNVIVAKFAVQIDKSDAEITWADNLDYDKNADYSGADGEITIGVGETKTLYFHTQFTSTWGRDGYAGADFTYEIGDGSIISYVGKAEEEGAESYVLTGLRKGTTILKATLNDSEGKYDGGDSVILLVTVK